MAMEIPGHRRRGQPKFRWKDRLKEDMWENNLNEHQVGEREEWKRLSRNSDPKDGKSCRKRRRRSSRLVEDPRQYP